MALPNEKRAKSKRKSRHKGGFLARARAGSFLLSRTAWLSARIRRSLGQGAASDVLCTDQQTEPSLQNCATSRLLQTIGFHETVSVPAKKAVAAGVCESRFFARLEKVRRAFLHTRARFFGIVGLVFSLYTCGIFFLRQFTDFGFGVADPADLCTAAGVFLISLLLLPCGKPINLFCAESRLLSRLFIGILGIWPDAWRPGEERVSTRGGTAFILGTLAGILTMLFRPHLVLFVALAGLFCICIPAAPEMGLLSAVIVLPVAPLRVVGVLVALTAFGYAQKFFRFKRVFRFRLPEVFLLLTVGMAALASQTTGDRYVLWRILLFACIWFLTVCMMSTERLHRKFLAALTYGGILTLLITALRMLMARYFPEVILPAIPIGPAETVLKGYILIDFPLALLHGRRRIGLTLLLLIALNVYLLGSMWLCIGLLLVLVVYLAFARGAWAGAALTGAVGLPAAVLLIGNRLGGLNAGFSKAASTLASKYLLCGIGSGNGALLTASLANGLMPDGFRTGLYTRLLLEGGILLLGVFLASAFCAGRRLFGCLRTAEGDCRRECGGLAAALLVFLGVALFTDVWSDLRLLGLFWCICPAASLAGDVYGFEPKKENVWQWI